MIGDNLERVRVDFEAMKAHPRVVASQMARAYALEAGKRIVMKTPVDRGRARGNWQLDEGTPGAPIDAGEDPSPVGSPGGRAAEIAEEALAVSGEEAIYIHNALPYIPLLDLGGYVQVPGGTAKLTPSGYSRQAPQGMVDVTMAELKALEKQLAEVIRVTARRHLTTGT